MAYIDTPRNKKSRVLSSVDDRHPKYKESIRNDIALIHSDYQLTTFDTRPSAKYDSYSILAPIPGNRKYSKYTFFKYPKRKSALQVFLSSHVLPYEPLVSPTNYQKEMELLAKSLPSRRTRSPMLYRLSEKWVVDDLGRFYYFEKGSSDRPNNRKLVWMQYKISGDVRNTITLSNNDPKDKLTLSVYTFAGLAGYDSDLQDYFISSGRYHFHHIEENKLDIRPTRVVPLEIYLHNYIHDQYTLSKGWFSRSKLFYIYS